MPELMVWRFLQTFGGSPGLSVGAGVVGDIYRLEERGTAMGVFFGVSISTRKILKNCLSEPLGRDLSFFDRL